MVSVILLIPFSYCLGGFLSTFMTQLNNVIVVGVPRGLSQLSVQSLDFCSGHCVKVVRSSPVLGSALCTESS